MGPFVTFCHGSHCGVSLCAVRGKACFREFHTLWLLEIASFSLQDFLCISFVVCTFVRHIHVDLFSLLLCAFLHADSCAVHVCFVDESLLYLQHLELHYFFISNNTARPRGAWWTTVNTVIDWQTWLVTIFCKIKKLGHSIFINYAKKWTFFILNAGCRLISNYILVFDLNNHKIYL